MKSTKETAQLLHGILREEIRRKVLRAFPKNWKGRNNFPKSQCENLRIFLTRKIHSVPNLNRHFQKIDRVERLKDLKFTIHMCWLISRKI